MQAGTSKQIIAFSEWRTHGALVPAAMLGMMLLAIHPYTLGVVIAPLEAAYGWSRSQISLGPLITGLVALGLAPFAGRVIDRVGPRPVALVGVPLWAAFFALIGLAGPQLWSFLACYALLGMAISLIYPTIWTAAVTRRFALNRGLALAIVLSGTGLASAFVPRVSAVLLAEYGWQGVFAGLAAGCFVVVYPLVLWLFARSPEVIKVEPQRNAAGKVQLLSGDFFSRKFLALGAAMLLYTLASTGLGINAVPVLMDKGFDLADASQVVGLIGLGTIVGRFLGGLLLDRFDGRFVAMGSGCAAMAAVLILLFVDQTPLTASIACVLLGLSAGAEFDACAYLASRHFPPHSFASLFGVISGMAGVGSGIAPMIANAVFDLTGSYDTGLIAIIPMFIAACVAFMVLGPYPADLEGEAKPA